MNEQAQRIAIAEACGANATAFGGRFVPDYPHDLNAMHESLKGQNRRFNFLFSEELDKTSTLRGCYVHELTAKDWANCFISVLQSKQDSLKVNA